MKIGTFFSGVGSPEQALNNLGIKHEIEFACDIDKYAKQTYMKNFNTKEFYSDITSLDMNVLPSVDLLIFGFPCQAFSIAGKRQGFEDTRGTLFYDALRYLKEHRPRYFIAENVRGLLSHENGQTFQTIIDCLAKTTNYQMSLMPFDNLGYHIHHKVLNTKDFGLPQNRERIFIIGIRDDQDNSFNFPKEIPLELKLKDILDDNIDSKYYLSKEQQDRLLNEPLNNTKGGGVKQVGTRLDSNSGTQPYQQDRIYDSDGISPSLSEGKSDLIVWVADYRNDEGLRIRKDNLSPCLASRKHSSTDISTMPPIIKQNRIRRLTPIECERLQGFPDNFTAGVSDTQRYKQMGNTITVNVIQAIIKNLLK